MLSKNERMSIHIRMGDSSPYIDHVLASSHSEDITSFLKGDLRLVMEPFISEVACMLTDSLMVQLLACLRRLHN